MRLTQHANMYPHRCAGLPYLGNGNASGFLDTGSELERGRVYLSFELICEGARLLGWQGPNAVKALEGQIAAQAARIDQLEAEVKEADRFMESAKYSFGKLADGQKIQKKPGRPKKETV